MKTGLSEIIVRSQCAVEPTQAGGVAQMVERSLSMREVPGSMPGASKVLFHFYILVPLVILQDVHCVTAQVVSRRLQSQTRPCGIYSGTFYHPETWPKR